MLTSQNDSSKRQVETNMSDQGTETTTSSTFSPANQRLATDALIWADIDRLTSHVQTTDWLTLIKLKQIRCHLNLN